MGDFDYRINFIDKGYIEGTITIGYFKYFNINDTAYDYV